MAKCGIYCIECLSDHKKYIGQSNNVKYRWNSHKSSLRRNEHKNSHLQAAWNKYGEDNFIFYILEECSIVDIDEREKYYIEKYNTTSDKYGYNYEGGGNANKDISLQTRNKQSQKKKEAYKSAEYNKKMRETTWGELRPICQVDLCGNIVHKWNCTVDEIEKKTNHLYVAKNISSCLSKGQIKTHKGYIWVYEDDFKENVIDLNDYKRTKINTGYSVYQYDFNGTLINFWKSTMETQKNGFSRRIVMDCCNGKYMQYKGYIWSYSELEKDIVLEKVKLIPQKIKTQYGYNLDNN